MTSRLRLARADLTHLAEGAAKVGVALDSPAFERFARYAELLDIWAPRTNLISCASARELVDRHFLDSLVLAELVADASTIVDLGSGAGFPGVPLAIAFPRTRVVLVEPRHRRASFLREIRRKVATNTDVLVRRAEGPKNAPGVAADVVVSRAVWSDEAIFTAAERWLRLGGRLVWIRGAESSAAAGADRMRALTATEYAIEGSHRGRIDVFEKIDVSDRQDCRT